MVLKVIPISTLVGIASLFFWFNSIKLVNPLKESSLLSTPVSSFKTTV